MRKNVESARTYINKKLRSKTTRLLYEEEKAKSEIARIIRTARERAGLTQRQLANKAKTTQAVIARLEAGTDSRMPGLPLIARLLHAAGAKLELVCRFNDAA